MSKIKAIIVDDEKKVREGLYYIITRFCHDVKVVGMAGSVDQAVKLIEDTQPEVILLDVEMPSKSGFEILDMIEEKSFDIIFVTAYEDFALRAIKVGAIDYIVKPVNIAELQMAFSKVIERREKASLMEIEEYKESRKLIFRDSKGLKLILPEELIRVQAQGNYSNLYLKDGGKLMVAKTLKVLENELDESLFIRVHQSHIVNMNYIKSFRHEGRSGKLTLHDGTEVEVSRSRKKEILERFHNT